MIREICVDLTLFADFVKLFICFCHNFQLKGISDYHLASLFLAIVIPYLCILVVWLTYRTPKSKATNIKVWHHSQFYNSQKVINISCQNKKSGLLIVFQRYPVKQLHLIENGWYNGYGLYIIVEPHLHFDYSTTEIMILLCNKHTFHSKSASHLNQLFHLSVLGSINYLVHRAQVRRISTCYH